MKKVNKVIIVIFIICANIIFICVGFNITKKQTTEFPGIKETTIKEMTEKNESNILNTLYFEEKNDIYTIKDVYGKTVNSFMGSFNYESAGPVAGRIVYNDTISQEFNETQIITYFTRTYYLVPNGNIEINPSEEK